MNKLTTERLAELREVLKAARPLPWRQGHSTHRLVDATGYEVASFHHGHEQVLVALLANAAPALLDAADESMRFRSAERHGYEVDALRAENERLREALESARVWALGALASKATGDPLRLPTGTGSWMNEALKEPTK